MILHALVSYIRDLRSLTATEGDNLSPPSYGVHGRLKSYIESRGGPLIFSYQVARLLGSIMLAILNLVTPYKPNIPGELLAQQLTSRIWYENIPSVDAELIKLLLGAVYVSRSCFYYYGMVNLQTWLIQLYTTLLFLFTLSLPKRWAVAASRHATTIYLLTFSVFAYRDLYPLATVNGRAQDGDEGPLLWIKIATLFVVGVIIPLVTPREYIPFDPKVQRILSLRLSAG